MSLSQTQGKLVSITNWNQARGEAPARRRLGKTGSPFAVVVASNHRRRNPAGVTPNRALKARERAASEP